MTKVPGPPEEEFVPEDDAIIGKAFRWSILAFVLIGGVVGIVAWQLKDGKVEVPTTQTTFVPPEVVESTAEAPNVAWVDMTRAAGIDYVHENGATGDKLLPETMGGGSAFFDYDDDDDPDLLFVNSQRWPGSAQAESVPTMRLYRNDGDWQFVDVTAEARLDVSFYGMGATVADYDGDGDSDIFFTAVGRNRLFRNDGGRYADVTDELGVAGSDDAWSTGSAFFDYDNDGDLDLFVCNYIKWSREIDFAVDYRLTGVGRAYGVPTNFEGAQSYLYRNDGDRFTDVSAEAGVHVTNAATGVPVGKALAVGLADIDADGRMDVVVANDTVQNFLFHNQGDGKFVELGAESGLAYDGMGNATGAMGTDVADFRNENKLGFGIGNFANEMTSLYLAGREPMQFTDVAIVEGIGSPSRHALTFGLFFFDYDLDGRLDLIHCNGHLEDEINKVQPSQHYRQPAQLFWNAGPDQRACFQEIPGSDLGDLSKPIVGRGAAYADVDSDGDLDVLLTQTGGVPMLLRNDQALNNHWLRIRLVDKSKNRDAIGAWIELKAGGITQRRQVMPTRSYLSQVELPITFGLGDNKHVDAITIRWPDGKRQEVLPLRSVDRVLVIERE